MEDSPEDLKTAELQPCGLRDFSDQKWNQSHSWVLVTVINVLKLNNRENTNDKKRNDGNGLDGSDYSYCERQ